MEAAPKLPMSSFDLKVSTEYASFGPPLKQYIANYYHEDPESYNAEIRNLESLRVAAIRPSIDVAGVELLKKYYCQLHFLKSRFPMESGQAAAVTFTWKEHFSSATSSVSDIRFELMSILYNIGALHSQLGALDSRNTPEGMKMACTHFQCAAWAFQTVKEKYFEMINFPVMLQIIHFMQQVCLVQAQECILEKSMLDNRKATIIAKVAVQVFDYYRRALVILQGAADQGLMYETIDKPYKEWVKYLSFKAAYHRCISLLFQGQQAEEQQKMGERVAFYQAACEELENARKFAAGLKHQQEITEALAFTSDVVEGKRKAAKNENEFIYHEEVPSVQVLQEVKGASLVKGIPFSVNDVEVSGPDIFARLVPMEAHEASSLYSEKKAEILRQLGELVESKDQALAEFMSSMQLDILNKMHQASGIPQELIDRAAALSARPMAVQDLIDSMGKLSNIYHEVESMLNEIEELLKEEEKNEKDYQEIMGKRPPSIIATDLAREAAKYREAHTKANDSNQTLHRAMTAHVANLKILNQPLRQLQQQLPSVDLPDANIDEKCIKELESLVAKVEEMRTQRAMLWAQFREAVHKDDITSILVTKQPNQSLEDLFQQELQKHQQLATLIEQNATAQENIKKALVDAYANALNTRRYVQNILQKRTSTIASLITSYDTYEDLLSKANKGIEFYTKLEGNVTKLVQRIRSSCKVQQEERDQMLLKNEVPKTDLVSGAPKLKDYLESRKKTGTGTNNSIPYSSANFPANVIQNPTDPQLWPPGIRPAPVGSEVNNDPMPKANPQELYCNYGATNIPYGYSQTGGIPISNYSYPYNTASMYSTSITNQNAQQYNASILPVGLPTTAAGNQPEHKIEEDLANRMSALRTDLHSTQVPQYSPTVVYSYSSYVPQNYTNSTIGYTSQASADYSESLNNSSQYSYDPSKANTSVTNSYQPNSSPMPNTNIHSSVYKQHQETAYPNNSSTLTSSMQPAMANSSHVPPSNYSSDQQINYSNQYQYLHATSASDTYYPPGYAPNYSYPTHQQYPNDKHSLDPQYATSVQPNVINANSNYTYSSPVIDTLSSHAGQPSQMAATMSVDSENTPAYNYSDPQAYQPYNSPLGSYASTQSAYGSYYQMQSSNNISTTEYYQPNVYNYAVQSNSHSVSINTTQTQSVPVSASVSSNAPKESNIDLLSGLDFSINQAPLIPQQNPTKSESALPNTDIQNKTETKAKEIDKPSVKPSKLTKKVLNSKPLYNNDVKILFNQECDKFEKYVDILTSKTLSGPTTLDVKWKEIQDKQDCESQKKSISVARCYPMKNRFPDILPYDHSRVVLAGAKDDYINASYIKDVSPYAPRFIVTQAPMPSTFIDFWTMIMEQQVELIFCLLSDKEIGEDVYWPNEKGINLNILNMVITLQHAITKTHWVERLFTVTTENRESTTVMHLQFTSWPGSLFPTSPEGFVSYTTELLTLYQQQRCLSHPVVVHCASGIGRSGLVCLLATAILDATNNATSVPDLAALTSKLATYKKNILRDREHLKFAYESFLCYMKQIIAPKFPAKRQSDVTSQEEGKPISEIRPQNDDPLNSLDPFWASKKN